MADFADEEDTVAKVDTILAKLDADEAPKTEAAPAQESETVTAKPETEDDAAPPAEEPAVSGEEAEPEPAVQPVIEPPVTWDASAKEEFAKLPPSVQRKVVDRETEVQRNLSERGRELAEAKKASEQFQQERLQYLQRLKDYEERALFQDPIIAHGRKANWAQLAQQLPPDQYQLHRAAYEQQERELYAVQHERQRVAAEAQNAAVSQAKSTLASILGEEFTNDAKWKLLAQDVTDYLKEKGVPRERYQGLEDRVIANPAEFLVVVDAVRGRRLTKAAETLKEKKIVPKPGPAARTKAAGVVPKVASPLQDKLNRARNPLATDKDKIAALEAAFEQGL